MHTKKSNNTILSLFESIVNESNDAIITKTLKGIITSWNQAAEKLFGYTAEEAIGRHISIIIPQQHRDEGEAMIKKVQTGQYIRHFETERVCKNGRVIYTSITLSPIKDAAGNITGIMKIARDITRQKQEEALRELLTAISRLFSTAEPLNATIGKALNAIMQFGGFPMGECWLLESEKNKIYLAASVYAHPAVYQAFGVDKPIVTGTKGRGLPGKAWQEATTQFWENIDEPGLFIRYKNAKKAGLKAAYAFPLLHQQKVLGIVILASANNQRKEPAFETMLENSCLQLGHEIQHMLLEQELNKVFCFTPDVLCIVNTNGQFKKVNPAMCTLLEYSESELLASTFLQFVHPADTEKTVAVLQDLMHGKPFYHIENRFTTKSGETKWLAWTTTKASAPGEFYCSAKDITEKKNLERLLYKSTNLARIGSWEVDIVKGTVYWSALTKELLEADPGFTPGIEHGLQFYKEGESRQLITEVFTRAITMGEPWDVEVQAVTAKGNIKWIRVIGEPEFINGQCLRIAGSFQDIDKLKQAELAAKAAFEERNTILESIADGFFAVDNNWQVLYWNSSAEEALFTPRQKILHKQLWQVFSSSIGSLSWHCYHQAMQTGQAVHFEDYYDQLQRWFDVSAYPSATGLSVYFKDITARKQVQAALEESERRYHDLFHLSPLPMWIVNLDTLAFLDVNRATVKHYGYTRGEFLSMTLADIRNPEDLPRLMLDIAESKGTGRVKNLIVDHRKKNGEMIKVAIDIAPVIFNGVNANLVIATDVTKRLRDTQAIQEQNEQLKKIAWLQSHVIRAPLARMMGLIDLVKNVTGIEEKEQYLDYIVSSAQELDEIIRQITIQTKTLQ